MYTSSSPSLFELFYSSQIIHMFMYWERFKVSLHHQKQNIYRLTVANMTDTKRKSGSNKDKGMYLTNVGVTKAYSRRSQRMLLFS